VPGKSASNQFMRFSIIFPFSALLCSLFFCASTHAQAEEAQPSKPVLDKGDITRFIQSFTRMRDEFEKLGFRIDSRESLTAALGELRANEDVQKILEDHGWDVKTYFPKMMAITMGYTYRRLEKEMETLPANQRSMAESMIKAQLPTVEIHPEDEQQVAANMEKLTSFFESLR